MDFVALNSHPLWEQLWSEKFVQDKERAIRQQLLSTAVTDPHTLGELRGQLKALEWLKERVDAEAQMQMKKAAGETDQPSERVAPVGWLRRRRIV